MATPPEHHRAIAAHIQSSCAEVSDVIEYTADGTDVRMPIAIIKNYPKAGQCLLSTMGLSDHCGYEIMTIAAIKNRSLINGLFDVASYIIDNDLDLRGEDRLREKMIGQFYRKANAAHWLFIADDEWHSAIPKTSVQKNKTLDWLHAIPITSEELLMYEAIGSKKFIHALKEAALDFTDLNRASLPEAQAYEVKWS